MRTILELSKEAGITPQNVLKTVKRFGIPPIHVNPVRYALNIRQYNDVRRVLLARKNGRRPKIGEPKAAQRKGLERGNRI